MILNYKTDSSDLRKKIDNKNIEIRTQERPSFTHVISLVDSSQETEILILNRNVTQRILIKDSEIKILERDLLVENLDKEFKDLKELIEQFQEIECESSQVLPYKILNDQYFDLHVECFFNQFKSLDSSLEEVIVQNIQDFLEFWDEEEYDQVDNAQLREVKFNLVSLIELFKQDEKEVKNNFEDLMTIYEI